jgi:hypothetical protein
MIRADASIKHATGSYVSCFTTCADLWEDLASRGHELGWHLHHLSYPGGRQKFDPDPNWLPEAHAALSKYFPIHATRTGWDYANAATFRRLDALNVAVDLSALPGQVIWRRLGADRFVVDWQRCAPAPYRPAADDYQRPGSGSLSLIELPASFFRRATASTIKQAGWRVLHGMWPSAGVAARMHLFTDPWPDEPPVRTPVLVLFFHPEDLTADGIRHFAHNLGKLRRWFDPEFVTARIAATRLAKSDMLRYASVPDHR